MERPGRSAGQQPLILCEGAPLLVEWFGTLTGESVYYRFLSPHKKMPTEMPARFTQVDGNPGYGRGSMLNRSLEALCYRTPR